MSMDLHAIRRRVSSLFAGFTAGQKAMLGIAVLAVVVGGWMFTTWAAQPSLAPLYTGLESGDAAAVTEELAARGVAYELEDGGRTVMVPQAEVYQLRLDMSASGLPAGGQSGYALLDDQGITTSEFRQRVDYQRALEGELSKTIGAIDGVEATTVHLVIPEEDLFSQDATKPSASVLVKTARGTSLDNGQVQAVVHLVASSVEGLLPGDVTVADSSGKVLSAPGQESGAGGDARSEQQGAFEDKLATSVERMLATVVGPGHAAVTVSADLDFDERNTTTERFDTPETGAPAVSETTTEETYAGASGGATGILGVDGTPVGGDDGATPTDYAKTQAERTFAVGKVTEQVKSAPGAVKRLSVAVLLDGTVAADVDTAEIEDLVTAAAGLDAARNDVVTVSSMAFDTTAAEAAQADLEAAGAAASKDQVLDLARTGAVVLIIVLVLLLMLRSARKAAKRAPVSEPVPASELALQGASIELGDGAAGGAAGALPLADEQRALVAGHIGSLIDQQPDEVAQLLRSWLADRRS